MNTAKKETFIFLIFTIINRSASDFFYCDDFFKYN